MLGAGARSHTTMKHAGPLVLGVALSAALLLVARGGGRAAGALAPELARGADPTISFAPRASNDTRVRVAYYMLAKCPYCEKVSTTIFRDLFGGGYDDIVDIIAFKVVPFGFSTFNGTRWSCMHGHDECEAMAYELCALTTLAGGDYSALADGRTAVAAWPFIECMEYASGDPAAADGCLAAAPGVNASAVRACYAAEFDDVMHAAGAVTGELCNEPSGCLEWTPWVTIDGVLPWGASGSPGYHDEKLIDAICNAYEGEPPASCTNSSLHPAPPSSVAAAVATRAEFRARAPALDGGDRCMRP